MPKRPLALLCFSALLMLVHGAAAQEIPWQIGRWNADSFGNQRVVLHVDAASGPVRAEIGWRRRDANPQAKRWIVTDDQGVRISNAISFAITRDSGDVAFDAVHGPANYYLYYLPYTGSVRSNYPKITYPSPDSTAAAQWAATARSNAASLPRATVIAFEAVDTLSQRWPMQVIATPSEVAAARSRAAVGQPYIVFVEDRSNPIKMTDDLPVTWATRTPGPTTLGPAERDEYYSFQLGIWGLTSVDSVRVGFGEFKGTTGAMIPATAFDCITTDGKNWVGKRINHDLTVQAGKVTAVWCGAMIPRAAVAGDYDGTAHVVGAGKRDLAVPIRLRVSPAVAINHGDDEPWRLSRLRWLNSTLAATGKPIAPYTAVIGGPADFHILGRRIVLDALGLPRQLYTSFSSDMTIQTATSRAMLSAPFALEVEDAPGKVGHWVPGTLRTTRATASSAAFHSSGRQGNIHLDVNGQLDFDGNIEYRVALVASKDTPVRDVRLVVPMRAEQARYFMGMNRKGGEIPATYDWKWDVANHNQDAFWMGNVDGGLQLTLKDEHYTRPLNTNFYLQSPLKLPRSWGNDGHGGCNFAQDQATYRATCFSGPRTLAAGDTLWYDFRVIVTPFHVIDTKTHFSTRYMHAYKPVDTAKAVGANLVNVHHATDINPFINYPFLRPAAMKAYADSLHAAGMRLKIYYTVRELTNHAPEIWALRSLGTEVLSGGPGGGHSWLQENMVSNYLPGWYVPERRDVAMVTSGISRWHNFYVEGMRWLTEHAGVDGIYLDDVAFDRNTMMRIRRVLTEHGTPGERIDLHSANQFDKNDGFASSANLYLEHFPYIDRLWFGEYFDYNSPPDYWLIEMSGIPFGLMGEMLQDGGNPWRGMVFGMTNRLPWTGGDPRELWKAWDAFGLNDATMRGWWMDNPPVSTGRKDVLATTYLRPGRAMIAVASWATDTVSVPMHIDWRALGLDSTKVRITAPAIAAFQPARSFRVGEPIPVAPGHGWLLRLDPL
jgi:glycosyl hydrolase family 123